MLANIFVRFVGTWSF